MLVLNFKTYSETAGENLDSKLSAVSEVITEHPDLANKIWVAPNSAQLYYARVNYPQLQLVAQHADVNPQGQSTGWLPLSLIKQLGINFCLVNHSEHKLAVQDVLNFIEQARLLDIHVIACCETIEEAQQILPAQPYALLFEDPQLIGTGVSITTNPQGIKDFVALFPEQSTTVPIAGAGISNQNDVHEALALGAKGVVVASAFAKAAGPANKLSELVSPFLS